MSEETDVAVATPEVRDELARVECPHCGRLLFYAERAGCGKAPVRIEYKCHGAGCRRVLQLLVPPPVAETPRVC